MSLSNSHHVLTTAPPLLVSNPRSIPSARGRYRALGAKLSAPARSFNSPPLVLQRACQTHTMYLLQHPRHLFPISGQYRAHALGIGPWGKNYPLPPDLSIHRPLCFNEPVKPTPFTYYSTPATRFQSQVNTERTRSVSGLGDEITHPRPICQLAASSSPTVLSNPHRILTTASPPLISNPRSILHARAGYQASGAKSPAFAQSSNSLPFALQRGCQTHTIYLPWTPHQLFSMAGQSRAHVLGIRSWR
jgi:hypothetical protein